MIGSAALLGLVPLAGGPVASADVTPSALPDWVTITNGTVTLGVWATGELNVPAGVAQPGGGTTDVGLRFVPTGHEATAADCRCEGWGLADATTRVSGFTDRDLDMPVNLTVESFTATADSAVSTVLVGDPAQPVMRVTHDYHPSSSANLYEVTVTIENLSGAPVDPRYRRVVDWDIEPTAGSEWVTVQGTEASADVLFASNDGFALADPLADQAGSVTGDFEDNGPDDQGALFDFGFDPIAPGATFAFKTYYGAAATEAGADSALAAVNAAVYSYGQPDTEDGPTEGEPNTFIYAYGGEAAPPVVPEVRFDSATYSVNEAAGTMAVGVQLSAATTVPVTVAYATAAGTATPGEDYTETSGTLTFPAGTTTESFTVPILDDTVVEGDETVNLALSEPAAGVLGTPASAVLTIVDDDVASPPAEVERWYGTDRYGTAAAIAEQWAPGVPLVYIASGADFPDALTAGARAGTDDAPMLLVRPDNIPGVTAAALERLDPARIIVLGGSGAVSDDVVGALAAYATADTADEVTRLSGSNRYATAGAVAAGFGTDVPVVYVASGQDFPDALAGGARAGLDGGPVLLTRTSSLPAATRTALEAANPGRIVVLGGSVPVHDDVVAELAAYTDGTVTRLSGDDRYGTASRISELTGTPAPVVFIATGEAFPDALTSGPSAVRMSGPILLTRQDELPGGTIAELERLNPARIVVLGGTVAVSTAVQESLTAYLD